MVLAFLRRHYYLNMGLEFRLLRVIISIPDNRHSLSPFCSCHESWCPVGGTIRGRISKNERYTTVGNYHGRRSFPARPYRDCSRYLGTPHYCYRSIPTLRNLAFMGTFWRRRLSLRFSCSFPRYLPCLRKCECPGSLMFLLVPAIELSILPSMF